MAFRPVDTPYGRLEGNRLRRAKEMYKAYDTDNSGGIDLKEFAALCTNYDDTITYHGIKAQFDQCNADKNDIIDQEEFYAWVALCFGQCDDEEFMFGTEALLKAVKSKEPDPDLVAQIEEEMRRPKPMNPAIAPDGSRRTGFSIPIHHSTLPQEVLFWANKCFSLYSQEHLKINFNLTTFTRTVRFYDPGLTEESLHEMLKMVGASRTPPKKNAMGARFITVAFSQFMAYSEMMFGSEPHNFETSMIDLIRSGSEMLEATLTAARRELAEGLFRAYDLDHSGGIDLNELAKIYKNVDPDIPKSVLAKTIEAVGADHNDLDMPCFCRWVGFMWGDTSEHLFSEKVQQLLEAAIGFAAERDMENMRRQQMGLPPL